MKKNPYSIDIEGKMRCMYCSQPQGVEEQARLLAEARDVIEAVEWIEGAVEDVFYCAWCKERNIADVDTKPTTHKPDCPRQAILAKLGRQGA